MYGDSATIVSVPAAGRPANTWSANTASGIPTPSSAMAFAFDFPRDRRILANTSDTPCIFAFLILHRVILLFSVLSVSSVVKSEKLNTEFAENRRGPQRSLPSFIDQ